VLFYVWDRPAGGDSGQYPRQQLKVVYADGVGAAHYSNADAAHEPVGAWLAEAEQPPVDPPTVVYDPWDPERVTLPATALLPTDRLQVIVKEYADTGERPSATAWIRVEWV
jgi:hypothetical protein